MTGQIRRHGIERVSHDLDRCINALGLVLDPRAPSDVARLHAELVDRYRVESPPPPVDTPLMFTSIPRGRYQVGDGQVFVSVDACRCVPAPPFGQPHSIGCRFGGVPAAPRWAFTGGDPFKINLQKRGGNSYKDVVVRVREVIPVWGGTIHRDGPEPVGRYVLYDVAGVAAIQPGKARVDPERLDSTLIPADLESGRCLVIADIVETPK